MTPPKHTRQELAKLPADFITKEVRRCRKVNERLKEELYWMEKDAWNFDTPESSAQSAIFDRLVDGRKFISLAESVLAEKNAFVKTKQRELFDKRITNLKDAVWMEFAIVTKNGIEAVEIETADDFYVKTLSKKYGAEKEGNVRKDVEKSFLSKLPDLHIEEWKLHYDCRDWNDSKDLPTWSLTFKFPDGRKDVKYTGRGDYPYCFFKAKEIFFKVRDELF